ncbi:transporter [Hydrogenimonas sp.]
MKRSIIRLFALVILVKQITYAESVIADRPGFSTGTYSLRPGKYNIEIGYNYTFNKTSSENDSQDFPLFELRTGVTERIEFDFLWNGWNMTKDFTKSSVTDVAPGGKHRLVQNNRYNFTLMMLVTLPTGDQSDFHMKDVSPLVGLLWDYTVDERVSFFGTLQASTYREEQRIYDVQPAVGVSFAHTEIFGTFLEAYSILPCSSAVSEEYVIDGGLTYLLRDNIQLDINGGIGLNRESNGFVGFGIAIGF